MNNNKTIKAIHQILPNFESKDAIGIHALELCQMLRGKGFYSEIIAEHVSAELKNISQPLSSYRRLINDQTIFIYHFAIFSTIPLLFLENSARHIIYYHNITPPEFFVWPQTRYLYEACLAGRCQIPFMVNVGDAFWTVSQFNAQELKHHGAKDVDVLPVLRSYEALTKLAVNEPLQKRLAGKKNILFVGRVSPNKGFHDLINTFYVYKKWVNPKVRLICAGSLTVCPYYVKRLQQLCQSLGLSFSKGLMTKGFDQSDIIFTDAISDQDLATLYRTAQLFLCLSDHEGFCVPLIEAMFFSLPIVAHPAAAVTETVGGCGLLVDKSRHVDLITAMKQALEDEPIKARLTERMKHPIKAFSKIELEQQLQRILDQTLQGWGM